MERVSKNIGIIIRHAPYGNQLSQEAIDATLASSVYGQTVNVIFMADGVFQLLAGQDTSGIQQKSFQKQLAAFELYDIDTVFVCEQSLTERGIQQDQLSLKSSCLSPADITQLLHQQDTLLSF